jgi:hypothetical protein
VPAGYSTVYVLTQGEGLVIVNAGATPSFNVAEAGDYTIHTLVYDPNTLDLSIVVPGETTGFDVNSLLIQGGGTICASLDVAGAPVSVVTCEEPCTALAGTLGVNKHLCLEDGPVTISATPNGDAVVPAGYSTVFVLTQGEGLVIVNAGAAPSFEVAEAGDYTIHTLVYDPNTLDLSIVVPGETTGFDVNSLLIQGGGSICASLDVAGAAFTVVACEEPCLADAGTLNGLNKVCLEAVGTTISATPNGDAIVPAGFSTVYVLTQGDGLVIVNAGAEPTFSVTEAGDYTIHTLVYDPATLDLSIVELGVTTGFDVNSLLIQGGGTICASLDVAGAPVFVLDCGDLCEANAGTLGVNKFGCLGKGGLTITATPNGDDNVPAGFSTVYVLTNGEGLVIVNAGPVPSFEVTEEGLYTIHTLVYDPATLDLGIVEIGVTTGFDVNSLLIQGGGSICASLDVAGAQFNVTSCGSNDGLLTVLNAWPVPAMDQLNLELVNERTARTEMAVYDMQGNQRTSTVAVGKGAERMVVDVKSLPAGQYIIRMVSGDRVTTHRFTKVD